MTRLSVVTPVRDASHDFIRTRSSLVTQSADDIEWVVVDSSADQSEIPRNLPTNSSINVKYLWMPPQGIFAAMNNGLDQATGRYIYFLNAGDVLLSRETLRGVIENLQRLSEPAWAYADVEMLTDDGKAFTPKRWDYDKEQKRLFARGRFPCHQGTFVRTDVLRELGGFTPGYHVAGDYEVFLRLSTRYPCTYFNCTVARFAPGGESSRLWVQGIKEFHRARKAILDPRGFGAIHEATDTLSMFTKVWAYRMFWAPGRPLHRLVRRFKS